MKKKPSLISFLLLVWIWLFSGPVWAGAETPEKLRGIPIFEGSKVIQVIDGPKQWSAVMEVTANRDTVAEFYKKSLEADGWRTVSQSQYATGGVLQLEKGADVIQIALVNRKKDDKVVLLYNLVYIRKK